MGVDLDCTTITQAQTQTPRTVRGLRTPRTPRTLASACAADPNKSTFTVTLKTPDGDIVYECPPEQYVLDEAEEQELEGADELPYACRAGSCSACTGKVAPLAPPSRPAPAPVVHTRLLIRPPPPEAPRDRTACLAADRVWHDGRERLQFPRGGPEGGGLRAHLHSRACNTRPR